MQIYDPDAPTGSGSGTGPSTTSGNPPPAWRRVAGNSRQPCPVPTVETTDFMDTGAKA